MYRRNGKGVIMAEHKMSELEADEKFVGLFGSLLHQAVKTMRNAPKPEAEG
jgi:hypothetical protein